MKFTLIYDGSLTATGNKSRPGDVAVVRNYFHEQLVDLWDSHVVLRNLERTARIPLITVMEEKSTDFEYPPFLSNPDLLHREPIPPLEEGQLDLCGPIQKDTAVGYRPLIRQSLGLGCALDIIFLRHEDPGSLILQGGDIDGRIKTLFDALRIPSKEEEEASGTAPAANPLQCLLESDALISDLSIKTSRLLGAGTTALGKANAVRLVIDVTVKVLHVFPQNQCLVGG